jgi:hypothetical protein
MRDKGRTIMQDDSNDNGGMPDLFISRAPLIPLDFD